MQTITERIPNRLIIEKSPYLLQHAYNPVDWWPWCDEAFAKAKAEDKPIFLSIGYSTCHWCHVMAHESFEDDEVAAYLNEHFISIKVDREERPDVDHVYMTACTALTGSGGWPLTVFLTHERNPFFAGTYYPKENKYGRIGFLDLLERINNTWVSNRENVEQSSKNIALHINEKPRDVHSFEEELPFKVAETVMATYDEKYGGFGQEPKFPSPHNLMFLMRAAHLGRENKKIWRAVKGTLSAMARGGIRDHIGGGFCRYSTDRKWLAPHFEKMLYDNALLCMAYTEFWQKSGELDGIVHEIIAYVNREMKTVDGCFYTAQDADSEGVEGKFYCFVPSEIAEILGKSDGQKFCKLYDITDKGNFEGTNIPNLIEGDLETSNSEFAKACIQKLYEARKKRIAPITDNKVLLTSNSLMVVALARAGFAFKNNEYIESGKKCLDFLLTKLCSARLLAVWDGEKASQPATLDAYSYLIWAALEVYQSTHEEKYLDTAIKVHADMVRMFSSEDGGLYFTASDVTDIPVRGINSYDGATPSGQSVSAHNMLKLWHITGDDAYETQFKKLVDSLSESLVTAPTGHAWLLAAILYSQSGGIDVKIHKGKGFHEMLDSLRGFSPYMCIKIESEKDIATAYVCKDMSCQGPITDAKNLKKFVFD